MVLVDWLWFERMVWHGYWGKIKKSKSILAYRKLLSIEDFDLPSLALERLQFQIQQCLSILTSNFMIITKRLPNCMTSKLWSNILMLLWFHNGHCVVTMWLKWIRPCSLYISHQGQRYLPGLMGDGHCIGTPWIIYNTILFMKKVNLVRVQPITQTIIAE